MAKEDVIELEGTVIEAVSYTHLNNDRPRNNFNNRGGNFNNNRGNGGYNRGNAPQKEGGSK